MEKIAQYLSGSVYVKAIRDKNKWLETGFVPVHNKLLRDTSVSIQGRFLYTLILSHTFRGPNCFPGLESLGKAMGIKRKQVGIYISELKEKGWLTRKRRGLGKTNLYTPNKYIVPLFTR